MRGSASDMNFLAIVQQFVNPAVWFDKQPTWTFTLKLGVQSWSNLLV